MKNLISPKLPQALFAAVPILGGSLLTGSPNFRRINLVYKVDYLNADHPEESGR